jgi:hypothetical protein
MPVCLDCGARTIYVVNAAGKLMRFDALPDPEGDFVLIDLGARTRFLQARYSPPRDDIRGRDVRPRYIPHSATCPATGGYGAQWKRRQAAKAS